MGVSVLLIIVGFFLLIVGADILVKGSSNIAQKFNIPEMIIGLTIVCIGTSMPEIIITITSATKDYADLIVGNAVGSNLCNLLLILGLVSIIRPVKLENEIRVMHLPISILATLLVLFIGNTTFISDKFTINRVEGIILLIIAAIYFAYPVVIAIKDILKSKKDRKNIKKRKQISIITSIIYIIIGVLLLKFGGDFVVDESTKIAEVFGISERVIGLTIVAIGTALPELITSVVAVFKNDTSLAIGNLIGSSMLNLCLILGLGAVIKPLSFSAEFNDNLILLAISTTAIWIFTNIGEKNKITRFQGILMFLVFSIYIVKLFL